MRGVGKGDALDLSTFELEGDVIADDVLDDLAAIHGAIARDHRPFDGTRWLTGDGSRIHLCVAQSWAGSKANSPQEQQSTDVKSSAHKNLPPRLYSGCGGERASICLWCRRRAVGAGEATQTAA